MEFDGSESKMDRHNPTSPERLISKRFSRRPYGFWPGMTLILFSLVCFQTVGAGERLDRRGRSKISWEKIVCRTTPIKANRSEILKFIESFCAEAIGQEFGGSESEGNQSELKEIYTIDRSNRVMGESTAATQVLLHLKSIDGCKFSVDYSCARFLTRPTDECNIGDEAKQGGSVADGCSLWRTIPLR